jgi:hypothetical protein
MHDYIKNPKISKAHLPLHHIRKLKSSNNNVQLLIMVMLTTDLTCFFVSKGHNYVTTLESRRLATSTINIGDTKLIRDNFPFWHLLNTCGFDTWSDATRPNWNVATLGKNSCGMHILGANIDLSETLSNSYIFIIAYKPMFLNQARE